MSPPRSRKSRRRRTGSVVVMTAIFLSLLIACVSLAVDIGVLCVARTSLQRAVDAAAMAAVAELGSADATTGMANATSVVDEYLARNLGAGAATVQTSIVFGKARINDAATKHDFWPDELPPNALQVTVTQDVPVGFAKIFGLESRTITASATAAARARDYVIVIDCSGSMTFQSDESEVAADLDALGIPYDIPGDNHPARTTAMSLTYDGSDPAFQGVYAVGERFLPPSIRLQPLHATKHAAALSLGVIEGLGYDDQVAAVGYSSGVEWTEPLTVDYSRVATKLNGTNKYGGTRLHRGLQAARQELQSTRGRSAADKVIVLMTDGRSDPTAALAEAQLAADAGMTIHCVGLGTNIDYDLLNAIAELSGGLALYVDDTTDPAIYGPRLEEAFNTIATRAVGVALID